MPSNPLDIFATGGEPMRRHALRPYDIVATLAAMADDKGLVLSYVDGEAHLDLTAHSAVAPIRGGHSLRTLVALEVLAHLAIEGGEPSTDGEDATVSFGLITVVLPGCAYAAELFAAGEVAA